MNSKVQVKVQFPTGNNAGGEWQMYKVRDVAAHFGCTSRWITQLINQGRVNAFKPFGGNWRILPSEMWRLQREGLLVPRPLDGGDDVDEIHVPQEIADRIFPSRSRIE